MAEYGSQRTEQPENVNFEPIIRGLKSDILTWNKCKIHFLYVRFKCKRKKKWDENCWKKVPLEGGGGGYQIAEVMKKFPVLGTFP